MKKLLWLFMLMIFVLVISSFSVAETTKEDVTLTYWNRYSADPMKDGMQKLIADFEAKYPWIKIEENSTSDADYKTALPIVLASGDPPDFFYWYGGKALKQFVDAGLVYDLNDYYSKFNWEKDLGSSSLGAVNYDGVYRAVPTEGSMTLLYVNKTKFEEMGLDYPKHDEIINWEEFLNLCEKIKNKGVTPIILGNGDQWCIQLWTGYVIANNLGVDAFYDIHTVSSNRYLQHRRHMSKRTLRLHLCTS